MSLLVSSCMATSKSDMQPKVITLKYHQTACMAIPDIWYDFRTDTNGVCTLTNCTGRHPHEALRAEVPAEVADELTKIVREEKMKDYKDFYHPIYQVLDGWQWDLYVRFEDKSSISSSGHMEKPSGEGLKRLEEYFKQVWSQVDEAKAETVNATAAL